ncbi:MAG: Gfo/Idh/MocA family oxidoreductase [Bacteroidetes bacterium]|nr:Gfo/Idh/MocA family oxidoreductase [Bacteroidota bacterium]
MVQNKIALVGVGHIGEIHLKLLLQSKIWHLSGVFDTSKNRLKKIVNTYKATVFESLDQAIDESDALCICTPAQSHFSIAKNAILKNKHVFIEKPVCFSYGETKLLANLLKKHLSVKCQIGHIERFNDAFVLLKKEAKNIYFIEINRFAKYNKRGTDVSVLADLSIHDIDLACMLAQSTLAGCKVEGKKIVSKTVDKVSIQLRFKNNIVVSINTNRCDLENVRTIKVYCKRTIFLADLFNKQITSVNLPKVNSTKALINFENNIKQAQAINIQKTNAIFEEHCSFYNAINKNKKIAVTINETLEVMKIVDTLEKLLQKNE